MEISLETGITGVVGDTGLGYLNSLTQSHDGRLITVGGILREGFPRKVDYFISELDRTTGLGRTLFPIDTGGVRSLTFGPGGLLFGFSVPNSISQNPAINGFFSFNLESGEANGINNDFSRGHLQAMTLSPEGILYGWNITFDDERVSSLATIDHQTGELSLLDNGQDFKIFQSIDFDEDGRLYGLTQTNLYQIDVSTGRYTEIGRTQFNDLRGLSIRPIPEPHTSLVAVLAALLFGFRRNR